MHTLNREEGFKKEDEYKPELMCILNERFVQPIMNVKTGKIWTLAENDVKYGIDLLLTSGHYVIGTELKQGNYLRFYFSNESLTGWNKLYDYCKEYDRVFYVFWLLDLNKNKNKNKVCIITNKEKIRKMMDLNNSEGCIIPHVGYKGHAHLFISDYANPNKEAYKPELKGVDWACYKSFNEEFFDYIIDLKK